MYVYLAMLAYAVVLFLTLRDIRIFRRTRFESYRKGAIKGILASTVIIVGIILTTFNPEMGLIVVLIALFLNQKGAREPAFKDATVMDRFLGKTDI